ncbi:MAG TPA: hypothetical protein VG672_00835 [Bryobacteraceae bacterium]|jgi:hypothetical protein|nr:hypothetical protein [Bryobacteraceae bacterium]
MVVCRRCKREFEPGATWTCPHCGEANPVATSGILKTSTILISADNVEAVYRSVKDVPVPLRKRLLKSTNGLNSATILIADRRGRDEITKAIRNLPSAMQQRLLHSVLGPDAPPAMLRWLTPTVRRGLAVLLAFGCLLFVWLVFSYRWR